MNRSAPALASSNLENMFHRLALVELACISSERNLTRVVRAVQWHCEN